MHLRGERALGKMRMERASVYMEPPMERGLAKPLAARLALLGPCGTGSPAPMSDGAAGSNGSCTMHVFP